jgi:uncharacterized protein YkwD
MLLTRHFYAFFAVGLLLFAVAPAALAARGSSTELNLLAAVNAARASNGLPPLRLDSRLRTAARSHSTDMLRRDYFTHGDFRRRMLAFHVQGFISGENLAWGSGPHGQPGPIVKEWLASPEHRANLLRPGYTLIGIGLARGSFLGYREVTVVTADFAGR